MTQIPTTPTTIVGTVVRTVVVLSAISTLVVLWLTWSALPAQATDTSITPDTTEQVPPTTDHEACEPEGIQVTDIDTGTSYIYSGGPIGFDSCGQPIPDICVQWEDGSFSTLWRTADCGPQTVETSTVAPPTTTPTATSTPPAPTLPATGGEAWLALIGAVSLFGGLTLIRLARS